MRTRPSETAAGANAKCLSTPETMMSKAVAHVRQQVSFVLSRFSSHEPTCHLLLCSLPRFDQDILVLVYFHSLSAPSPRAMAFARNLALTPTEAPSPDHRPRLLLGRPIQVVVPSVSWAATPHGFAGTTRVLTPSAAVSVLPVLEPGACSATPRAPGGTTGASPWPVMGGDEGTVPEPTFPVPV